MKINFSYEKEFETYLEELYEIYGGDIFDLEGIGWQTDLNLYNKSFFQGGDFLETDSVDTNANVRSANASTYFNEVYKPFTRLNGLYIIWKELKKEFGINVAHKFLKDEISGAIYVHDLHSATVVPYCFAYSLEYIINNGLTFIKTVNSRPAKHLSTFIQHVMQMVMFASNQTSGAVGLPDLFVWMNYFVRKELQFPIDELILKQYFQILIYSLNQPVRTNQAAFTNFTFMDRHYIKNLFFGKKYPDGSAIEEHIEDIIDLQKRFLQWFKEERKIQMFTFPVITASLLFIDGKFADDDSARFITDYNTEWQDINLYISASVDSLASCCRLKSSLSDIENPREDQLVGMANSIGGTDLNIGSFKVVTVNLPHIALEVMQDSLVSSIAEFMDIANARIDIAQKVLFIIRGLISERIDQGVLPLYSCGMMSLNRQFGTLGLTGMYEAAEIMGMELTTAGEYTDAGIEFVGNTLQLFNKNAFDGYKKYGFSFNVEQIPGEKACVILANKDRIIFDSDYMLYSNQWVPLFVDTLITSRIKYSSLFDKQVQGGAILHINLGAKIDNKDLYWELVNMIAKSGVVYFAFNTRISVCKLSHSFFGDKCPECGGDKVDEYLRIVGYLVPRSSYNKIRKNYEYGKRQFYKFGDGTLQPT